MYQYTTHGKMLSQNKIITNLRFQAVHTIKLLIYPMDLIQLQIFRITLNLLLKSMKPLKQMKILQY